MKKIYAMYWLMIPTVLVIMCVSCYVNLPRWRSERKNFDWTQFKKGHYGEFYIFGSTAEIGVAFSLILFLIGWSYLKTKKMELNKLLTLLHLLSVVGILGFCFNELLEYKHYAYLSLNMAREYNFNFEEVELSTTLTNALKYLLVSNILLVLNVIISKKKKDSPIAAA